MKFVGDFNLSAWITGVVVEAENEGAAYDALLGMTLEELIDAGGYIKQSEISDVDLTVESATYKVHVSAVDYDITEDDIEFQVGDVDAEIEAIKSELPQELDFTIELDSEDKDDLEAILIDMISDKTGYVVNSAQYEIIEVL